MKKYLFWVSIIFIFILGIIQTICLSTILFKFIAEALAVPTTLLVILAINIKNSNRCNIKKSNENENIINIIKTNYSEKYNIKYNIKLSSLINMNDKKLKDYKSESNRNIDICIQNKMNNNTLLLISINNDDIKNTKLRLICNICNIKFINFWSKYNNSEDYIIEQINENLGR